MSDSYLISIKRWNMQNTYGQVMISNYMAEDAYGNESFLTYSQHNLMKDDRPSSPVELSFDKLLPLPRKNLKHCLKHKSLVPFFMKWDCRSRKGNDGAGSKWIYGSGKSTRMMKLLDGLIRVQQVMFARIFVERLYKATESQNEKSSGENALDCIFIGYAKHSKCYRFYVIEPNDYVSVKTIMSQDVAMFVEIRLTSIPRPRGTRVMTYLHAEYGFIIEGIHRTLSDEGMDSRDVAFWKEAVQNPTMRPDIAFAVGKLSRIMVLLIRGGAISWASKKQTCITSSTMESEFVALAAAGNEAEWLRNLIYEIPLWPKLISTISIRCDSAATLAKLIVSVTNGKSRHWV
ncbi:zinc finger, CCHC-type containing protein [Tanacetum coccineum]